MNYAKIIDLGDLNCKGISKIEDIHNLVSVEYNKFGIDLKENKVLIIGGTSDIILPLIKTIKFERKWAIIHIDSGLDCREKIAGENHNGSIFKELHAEAVKTNGKIIHFGAIGSRCTKNDAYYAIQNNGEIYWSSQIQKGTSKSKVFNGFEINSRAGILITEILDNMSDYDIYISFDLSSVKVFG